MFSQNSDDGVSVSSPGVEINTGNESPRDEFSPNLFSPRAEVKSNINPPRVDVNQKNTTPRVENDRRQLEVNLGTPRPKAEVNIGRNQQRFEPNANASLPRAEFNPRVSQPRADINADVSRPRIEVNPGLSHRKPPDVRINNGRSPRVELDSSSTRLKNESELGQRRPHGQASVDARNSHNFSDNELPSPEVERPSLPKWKSTEEVDRARPRKRFDCSRIDYKKIYTKDQDLAKCNYRLTPQNNLWTKALSEGTVKLGSGYQKKWPRQRLPRTDRRTNWTEKVRKYQGTTYTPQLHHYNTVYTYDNCDPPYDLTYPNSRGFSHAIDKPRDVAPVRPSNESSVRVADHPHANIQTSGRRKRRAKTTCCCGDADVDTVEPQLRLEHHPPAVLHVENHPQTHHLDTPKATIHASNPVKPRAAVTVETPTKPVATIHRQSPELHQAVSTPHVQTTNSPRNRGTRKLGCCACCSDSDVEVTDTTSPHSNRKHEASKRDGSDSDAATVETSRMSVRVDTPPLNPDARLDLHGPSPRSYNIQTESPRMTPAAKLNTPRYSLKPLPSVHLKANNLNPLPTLYRHPASPTVKVSAPKPVEKPKLKVVKPNVHAVKPKAGFRVQTPKLHLKAPKIKPITIRKPTFKFNGPNFGVPEPKVPVSNFQYTGPKPNAKPINVHLAKPKAGFRVQTPKLNLKAPKIKPITIRKPTFKFNDPNFRVPESKVPVSNFRYAGPKPTAKPINVGIKKPVASRVQVQGPRIKVKEPELPKAGIYVEAPKPNVKENIDISASKPKPAEAPFISLRGPEIGKPKITRPCREPKVLAPKPVTKPTFADLHINAPRPSPIHIPSVRVETPDLDVSESLTPRAEFHAGVPKPTVKPLKAEIRAPSPVTPEFHADIPKPTVKPLKAEIRAPSPVTPEFHADIPKPIVKPLKADVGISTPQPEVRASVPRVPQTRINISPPSGRMHSPELQPEAKPPKVSLPPVSSTYYPLSPNGRIPSPSRLPPASVTLPKLRQPPKVSAQVDLSSPEVPAPRERYPPNEEPLPATSKLYQPPKTEHLKWRLHPDETKKGNRTLSPALTEGHLTYYPPSKVAVSSPRLRAGIY